MTLRKHGSQPRAETAATMEILEQRSSRTISLGEAEQLAIERVGELS
jgi:hypothetical protein